jgi:serine/threonine protein kinase
MYLFNSLHVASSFNLSMIHRLLGRSVVISAPQQVTHVLHLTELKIIGNGGFGTVSKIVHRPSMKVLASKLINPALVDDSSREESEAKSS